MVPEANVVEGRHYRGGWLVPYRRLVYTLKETMLRIVVLAFLVGGAWLLLQFYTEDEIILGTTRFWEWWSTRLTGDLAQYWNPAGAAITLGIAALFVLSPLSRLLGGRRRHGSHYSHDSDYGGGGDSGDGGDGGD